MTVRLIQRHDQFFKRLMDKPGAAGALLRERLPPAIAARLSDDPPELLPGSFVPPELREYRTDRLYRMRTVDGWPVLIHVLIEHKSAPDPRIGLQLLGYQTGIWQWLDEREGRNPDGSRAPLPPIIPLVVYHGAAEWRIPTSFAESLGCDGELRAHLLDFSYILVDLGRIDDVALSRETVLRVGLMILKRGSRNGDLRQTLLELGRAAAVLGFDEVVALVSYIIGEPNPVDADMLREVIREIMPEREEKIMSIAAEQWKAEGIQIGKAEGKAEGIAEGQARVLLRLLQRRFGEIPGTIMTEVMSANSEQLELWLDNILDAQSLDAMFQKRKSH